MRVLVLLREVAEVMVDIPGVALVVTDMNAMPDDFSKKVNA
jgi:hypothetical protein